MFLRVGDCINSYTEDTLKFFHENGIAALAGVAQWIEHRPAKQRVVGSIPSQGMCLGCGPGPQLGACEKQPHIDVSLPLFCLLYTSDAADDWLVV